VTIIKAMKTSTETIHITSINQGAIPLFTSSAYSPQARPRKVKGNEYSHHVTFNLFIDFLNMAGLQACIQQQTLTPSLPSNRLKQTKIYKRLEYQKRT